MLGRTNKTIQYLRVPQRLRRNMTEAESKLWRALRLQQFSGFKFRRQHPLGNYVLDFVCLSAKVVIEVDGSQHAEAVAVDEERSRFLEGAGFRVLRFWNNQVLGETEAVLIRIGEELERATATTPSPPPPSP